MCRHGTRDSIEEGPAFPRLQVPCELRSAPLSATAPSRHCLHEASGSGLCGRLLLARVPSSWVAAKTQRGVVEGKTREECRARQRHGRAIAERWMGRRQGVGARTTSRGVGCGGSRARFAWRPDSSGLSLVALREVPVAFSAGVGPAGQPCPFREVELRSRPHGYIAMLMWINDRQRKMQSVTRYPSAVAFHNVLAAVRPAACGASCLVAVSRGFGLRLMGHWLPGAHQPAGQRGMSPVST